jgi:hypothetical protein
MSFTTFIRSLVHSHPELKAKLSMAMKKETPFQYIYQIVTMTGLSTGALALIVFLATKSNPPIMLIALGLTLMFIPFIYKFWMSYIDVQIRKEGRELEGDLLFISEYFLVSLESGMPLGNAIQGLSKINRPGGRFFKKVYAEFMTGKDLEEALEDAIAYSPSQRMKILLKRLRDSLNIGVDLRSVLENFIEESSEQKIVEIKGYAKKLSPIIMMYLILGVVVPSLGVTFFILAAALLQLTPALLKYILIFIFLIMFGMQYLSYSAFKFSKSTL